MEYIFNERLALGCMCATSNVKMAVENPMFPKTHVIVYHGVIAKTKLILFVYNNDTVTRWWTNITCEKAMVPPRNNINGCRTGVSNLFLYDMPKLGYV